MTLSQNETVALFEFVLNSPPLRVRERLFLRLRDIKRTEPEFYMAVLKHIPYLNYNSEQWYDFLSKIPNRIFRDEIRIMKNSRRANESACLPQRSEADRRPRPCPNPNDLVIQFLAYKLASASGGHNLTFPCSNSTFR